MRVVYGYIRLMEGKHYIDVQENKMNWSFCSNDTPSVSFGESLVMVWGGIYLGARIELVVIDGGTLTADTYINFIDGTHN